MRVNENVSIMACSVSGRSRGLTLCSKATGLLNVEADLIVHNRRMEQAFIDVGTEVGVGWWKTWS